MPQQPKQTTSEITLISLLKPYTWTIVGIIILTLISNGLNLVGPQIVAHTIDTYGQGNFALKTVIFEFFSVAAGIFIFTYLQTIVQTYASERVARDLRKRFIAKISEQEYAYIQEVSPAKLLTNLTSDIDAVKTFVSQAIASLISSFFLIIGASILLLLINWKVALAVLVIVPIIGITFFVVLGRVRKLFKRAQETIDWLNKVINESILGAALIRLLNSQSYEYQKFLAANEESKNIGLSILRLFAGLIPVIIFTTNVATLIILIFGGHFVITGTMSLGDFTAFNSYLAILIFPILIIGFMSNVIAQASASLQRISLVLNSQQPENTGTLSSPLSGNIAVSGVTINYGERSSLKNVSFTIKAGTKTAIIGPTAAGKTQLLYAMTGLIKTSEGTISYDNHRIDEYKKVTLHKQIGFVFQDSIMFNLSVRENIAFSNTVTDQSLEKAIETAELHDFIDVLPEKLDTVVSERGTSLSGGQKQRIMLARALSLNPTILLLDDFTARVDSNTESKILANITRNYPDLTLVSVTQKIAPVETYDQIILLMEGEILATGTHEELLHKSPEYVQIYNSQKSTENYELQT
ncbi:MAG: transporter ATP-binding protein [Candidatus Kaiserbacteria bacterium]|nr:transporter ATP-binding protein [Candidatus Kaiserbacteria bacterium]